MDELLTRLAEALEAELGHFMRPDNDHAWRDVARGLVHKMGLHDYPKHLLQFGNNRGHVYFFID